MTYQALKSGPNRPAKLRLATHVHCEADGPPMPRWSKILDARDAIRAGAYDDPAVIDAKLDACLDALCSDLAGMS